MRSRDANAHSPGATAHVQSGQSYSGTVAVTGTLPAGYTVYVAFHGRVWVDLGPDGGGFHTQDEHVLVDSLVPRARLLSGLLLTLE